MSDAPALEDLLATLRASYHARRRDRLKAADAVTQALAGYVAALESVVALELATSHELARPKVPVDPARAAERLLAAVQSLPELALAPTKSVAPAPEQSPALPRAPRSTGTVSDSAAASVNDGLPHLTTATSRGPLVIVGGAPHKERLSHLPAELLQHIEWVDTTRQGTHAIGNLERRIREGRLAALVLLELLVQHRHSDPLISAARSVGLPHGYGGKGGKGALGEALASIERALSRAPELPGTV